MTISKSSDKVSKESRFFSQGIQNYSPCNSESEIMADNITIYPYIAEQVDMTNKVITICYLYVAPVICIVGIICNMVSLLVLTRRQLSSSPYVFLSWLAVSDCGLLLLFVLYVLEHQSTGTGGTIGFWTYTVKIIMATWVINAFSTASVWIAVLLTIDRVCFVYRPLWARYWCSVYKARLKIGCVFVTAFIFNLPRLFTKTTWRFNDTDFINDTSYRTSDEFYVYSWVHTVLVTFIPFIVLFVSNIFIMASVYRAKKFRQRMIAMRSYMTAKDQRFKKDEIRLTTTLVSIIFMFTICIIPSAFISQRIAHSVIGPGLLLSEFIASKTYRILQTVINMLVLINCSSNFFFYCAFNHHFVRTLSRLMDERRKLLWRAKHLFQKQRSDIVAQSSARSSPPEMNRSSSNTSSKKRKNYLELHRFVNKPSSVT